MGKYTWQDPKAWTWVQIQRQAVFFLSVIESIYKAEVSTDREWVGLYRRTIR